MTQHVSAWSIHKTRQLAYHHTDKKNHQWLVFTTEHLRQIKDSVHMRETELQEELCYNTETPKTRYLHRTNTEKIDTTMWKMFCTKNNVENGKFR